MGSAIQGLTPLPPDQLVEVSISDLRKMSIQELIAFSYQLGIDIQKVRAERGKLLTEIVNHVHA